MSEKKQHFRDVEEEDFIQVTQEHQIKHNHVLAIAIDYYEFMEDKYQLYNCVSDIDGVRNQEGEQKKAGLLQVLIKDYFFAPGNIRFLRSRGRDRELSEADLKELEKGKRSKEEIQKEILKKRAEAEKEKTGYAYVGEATHEEIIEQLRQLAQELTSDDNLLICYSGHGTFDEVFKEGYWIPSDGKSKKYATFIENGTIKTALNAIKTHHTVLISDSCYSGTLFSSGKQRATLDMPRIYKHPSRWGITAGRKEPVLDGEMGDNSPFMKELLNILSSKQEIWISELCNNILRGIETNNTKQTPAGEALAGIDGHLNGQFVFLPKHATEEDYWRIAWRKNTRKAYYAFLARYPDGEYAQVALKALNLFAVGETPVFSDKALDTYIFLLDKKTPEENIMEYLSKYIGGETNKYIEKLHKEIYEDVEKFQSKDKADQYIINYLTNEEVTENPIWRHKEKSSIIFYSVAFSPNGKHFAAGGSDGITRLWEVPGKRSPILLMGEKMKAIHALTFSNNGKWILTGEGNNKAKMWELKSGNKLGEFNGAIANKYIYGVAISKDDEYILTTSADGKAYLWNIDSINTSNYKVFKNKSQSYQYDGVFLEKKKMVITVGREGIKLWNRNTPQKEPVIFEKTHKNDMIDEESDGYPLLLDISVDEKYLIVGYLSGKNIEIWDLEKNEFKAQYTGTDEVKSITFSPNGRYILLGNADGKVILYSWDEDRITLKKQINPPEKATIQAVTFSPDGKYILAGARKGSVYLWINPFWEECSQ